MKPLIAGVRTSVVALSMLALSASGAVARDADVDLVYKVYIGGFHVVDLQLDIGFAPEKYDVKARINSSGTIGRMFPWTMDANSRGRFSDAGVVVPASARQKNTWRGKERFIDLSFADGIARVDRMKPVPETDDRDKVPEALRTGAVDLTSAIMALITQMDESAECRNSVPVFDGRRRYDLRVEPDGSDQLKPNRYSPFRGATTNCVVWIDKKAGFKRKDSSGWSDQQRRAKVWMGKAFASAPPVPIRLTFDTPYGGLIAHLNQATLTNGVGKQSLSQAD